MAVAAITFCFDNVLNFVEELCINSKSYNSETKKSRIHESQSKRKQCLVVREGTWGSEEILFPNGRMGLSSVEVTVSGGVLRMQLGGLSGSVG